MNGIQVQWKGHWLSLASRFLLIGRVPAAFLAQNGPTIALSAPRQRGFRGETACKHIGVLHVWVGPRKRHL